jgi:hypothetical protein
MVDTLICPKCEAVYITVRKASRLSGFAESTIRSWVREKLLEPVGQIGNNHILTEELLNEVLFELGYDPESQKFVTREER